MSPECLLLIRHNLDSACCLLQPGPAAREAFRTGLASLLLQTGRINNEEKARNYLAGLLGPTFLSYGGEAPRQNSSPVCYAQAQSLRPEFEEPVISGQRELPGSGKIARLPVNRLRGNHRLKEVLAAAQYSTSQILSGGDAISPADPVRDMQVEKLVRQLFSLPASTA